MGRSATYRAQIQKVSRQYVYDLVAKHKQIGEEAYLAKKAGGPRQHPTEVSTDYGIIQFFVCSNEHHKNNILIYILCFLSFMMLNIILMTVALLVLMIASYTDIKTREIPDWLNYSLIFAALGIRGIFSVHLGWNVLLSGVLGLTAFFVLAFIFYRTGQWGGGDSKLLMGMGAVIGISWPMQNSSLNLLWFFISLLFIGSIYGLVWMVVIATRKRHVFLSKIERKFTRKHKIHLALLIMILVVIVLGIAYNHLIFMTLLPVGIYYLLIFVNAVESNCFINKIKIERLTEGDWLAEDVFIGGKNFMSKRTLSRQDLHELYSMKKQRKIDYVTIKEGIPFTPSFLCAYLTILLGGNIFAWAMGKVF